MRQSNLKAISDILAAHNLFGALSKPQREHVIQAGSVMRYGPDKLLFSRGDAATQAYLIISGEVSIEVISPEGKVANIAVLSNQDIVGEFTILDNGLRSATARCLSDVTLLSIPKAVFLSLLDQSPAFALAMISLLVERLRETNKLVEGLTLMHLRQRLRRLLYALARSKTETDRPVIHITQSQLAERLSASREKVNGHLRQLQNMNIIENQRGAIQILSPERLMQ